MGTLYDRDIREPLFDFLESTFGKIRILEEKTTGGARADVVMITPQLLYGIEIKSDADTYTRLNNQVKYYNCFFDRNIIVTGSSHAAHIKEHVPDWWGVITVELDENGEVDFYIMRKPTALTASKSALPASFLSSKSLPLTVIPPKPSLVCAL